VPPFLQRLLQITQNSSRRQKSSAKVIGGLFNFFAREQFVKKVNFLLEMSTLALQGNFACKQGLLCLRMFASKRLPSMQTSMWQRRFASNAALERQSRDSKSDCLRSSNSGITRLFSDVRRPEKSIAEPNRSNEYSKSGDRPHSPENGPGELHD
jgi:hypothetical protein